MIFEENEKKEKKNEKLLVDLCECYHFLSKVALMDLFPVSVPILLKVASNKEESEEVQKEVEMALLALSSIGKNGEIEQKQYLNEIKEIIKYHQDHHNLTRLAYQSALEFLICRFYDSNVKGSFFVNERRRAKEEKLEEVILNELHFAREARREQEEMMKCVDWKRREEEKERGKEVPEEFVLVKWPRASKIFLRFYRLKNEEFLVLLSSVERVFQAAKENYRDICYSCVCMFDVAAGSKGVKVDHLLESGAIDAVLEEMHRSTLESRVTKKSFEFFVNVSLRTKGIAFDDDEEEEEYRKEEVKRKIIKRKMLEKMEEEGYEDIIISFHKTFGFIRKKFHGEFSLNVEDYFVNV
ncbi:uncharacterized protein MONOS_9398 [Monocercomonoides exilis]|uniref:uncharacterized protein n=1 Tax=Monocercomonoides exilis TaxID=2049356 RepID=UPI00355A1B69|nr:hypothetical protein MONOS_9398 [Monocercomonoides exilis]|eukprot:MONOS_9398.1-p1 / transcript=MONOS_9398.1 / gene=MONOS_9398 / organism=Monocercomonoides_exilis_PA203 / gene_product=unspecified product / transcript_product=unspecified product / location=Mono_scaffold00387:12302-13441(+) / protein_length=354 / sequence_SO=supercontig / SO=protein_coding / is_pseudo=false